MWNTHRALIIIGLCHGVVAGFARADDSWKLPLSDKEIALERNIVRLHNILGLYPSMVEIPKDGGPIDITTANPHADVQHAVCWTANYLAGCSYRYAFLKKTGAPSETVAVAKKRADEVFEAVYRCQRITGKRGLQARGYFLGHGETYAERYASDKLAHWYQGEADGQEFRWVGDQSHHNYSDAIHGLGQYYDLAAEGEQKDRCRDAIDALVSYWVDNDLIIYNDLNRPVPILGLTDGKTLNTRVMMAIAGAKVAHHATGNEKFKATYDKLVAQYGVRGLKAFKTEKNFDDAEHVFCHLENLFRMEKDPELLAAYRVVADGLWANHKGDAQSLFTYIYMNLAPDVASTPEGQTALQQALYSLQTWPTDMTYRPRMNSLNKNLKPPYPVYAAAWDNEYMWKGSLLQADGWLSRIVTDVAVPAEDPMVLYAIDQQGDLYQSRDGAAAASGWRPIDTGLPSPARAIDAGPRVRMVYAACDDGFFLTTTGGAAWKRMPVPFAGKPLDVVLDLQAANVIFAVTDKGIWRSVDFGEQFIGQAWECLTHGLPAASNASYYAAPGTPGRIYAILDGALFTRRLDEESWTRGGALGFPEETRSYPWFVMDPSNPDRAVCGLWSEYGGLGTVSMVRQTSDAGQTWTPNMETLYKRFSEGGMMGLFALLVMGKIGRPAIDPQNPKVMFLPGDARGVLKSSDGGQNWQEKNTGLDIPFVSTILAPRHSEWVFAGTPAGLFISKDGGESWQDGHLCLQFTKNTRRDLGGAGYIDAYWRARYYGFIEDATAAAPYSGG